MKSEIFAAVAVLLVITTSPTAANPTTFKGATLAKQARVTLATARAAALKARAGRVTDEELERERGGSGLRYSFDILSQGKSYEVGVDAMTGKILENVAEGTNPD